MYLFPFPNLFLILYLLLSFSSIAMQLLKVTALFRRWKTQVRKRLRCLNPCHLLACFWLVDDLFSFFLLLHLIENWIKEVLALELAFLHFDLYSNFSLYCRSRRERWWEKEEKKFFVKVFYGGHQTHNLFSYLRIEITDNERKE